MSLEPPAARRAWINGIGFAILAACYAAALLNVARRRQAEAEHEVIRIAHWQLELGVRDGLDELIRAFERQKAREGRPVRVIQILMPEQSYQQYVTTQLIGGTAPDMIQLGKFPEEYIGRYFLPLSKVLQQPNPFVAAEGAAMAAAARGGDAEAAACARACDDLAGLSWMDTFSDGLRSMFRDRFQEYFGVGFSQFTLRMFYNRRIFREVLGSDEPPRSYRELLAACERIAAHAAASGQRLDPIASSGYQMLHLKHNYLHSVTRDIAVDNDLNLDGTFDGVERLAAVLRGRAGPREEQYRAGIEAGRAFARYFPAGFMALGRMDAGFAFVQGRAAMIMSGSWDARSFLKQIRDQPPDRRFEVGMFDLPPIGRADPVYGRFEDGRGSEAATGTGFAFGITRHTRHFDLCVEFLRFCTTPRNNSLLNERAAWIPSVIGARMSPLMEAFRPNYVGLWGGMALSVVAQGRVETLETQEYWPYVSGQIEYDAYADNLVRGLPAAAAVDFRRLYDEKRDESPGRNARRSAYLALSVLGPPDARQENEIKLLRAVNALASLERRQRDLDGLLGSLRAGAARGEGDAALATAFFEALDR